MFECIGLQTEQVSKKDVRNGGTVRSHAIGDGMFRSSLVDDVTNFSDQSSDGGQVTSGEGPAILPSTSPDSTQKDTFEGCAGHGMRLPSP